MTYLVCVILIVYGIIKFDYGKDKDSGSQFFNFVLILLILVSGLAYRIGDDATAYEEAYSMYGTISDIDLAYLQNFPGRLPGWVLLSTLCKTICSSFWFFKIVISIIINVSFASFIKRTTPFVFSSLLVFWGMLYFSLNFGILRQAISVSIFLYSLQFLKKKDLLRYYLLVFLALLFHESAYVLIIIPIFYILKLNKYSVTLYIVLGVLVLLKADLLFNQFSSLGYQEDSLSRLTYYSKLYENVGLALGFYNILLNIVIPLAIIIYRYINKQIFYANQEAQSYTYLVVLYLFTYILSSFLPIIYRVNYYFTIFYYIIFVDTIGNYLLSRRPLFFRRAVINLIIVFILIVAKNRSLFKNYPETNIPAYVSIYPYESVIFKVKNPERESLFNYLH